MRINEVIEELKKTYPGKKIILNDKNNLTEILCEVDPPSKHSAYSVAVSVIDETIPHYHNEATEVYEILRGEVDFIIDGKVFHLKTGELLTIQPGEVHSFKGNETWIKCTAKPAWKISDHIKT